MEKIFLFIVTFVAFVSCETKQSVTLNDDPVVNKIFNKEEIAALNIIVDYFDSIVVNNTKEHNINQAYYKYFSNIDTLESFKELKNHLELNNYNGINALINKLTERNIFNEIWKYSYEHEYRLNDTLLLRLSLNMQGKYFHLLELLGKNNKFMRIYSNSMQATGCINPSLIASVIKRYKNIDFQISVNRLVWAVHYITILYKKPYTSK